MLSRVAENMFWLGRYLERADNVARLADAHSQATVEHFSADEGQAWDPVIDALGAREAYDAARAEQPDTSPAGFVIHSTEYAQSVSSSIGAARGLARELREHISREVFEEINRLYLTPTVIAGDDQALRAFTASVRRTVAATIGLFDHTVLLTEASEWFRCGLFIERADMTSRIVDSKYFVLLPSTAEVGGPLDRYQWMSVLRSASALEAFHKRQRGAAAGPAALALLLFDRDFPRSLAYCVQELKQHFEAAIGGTPSPETVVPAREIALLELDVRAMTVQGVIDLGFHEFLDGFQLRLIGIDDALREHVFGTNPAAMLRDPALSTAAPQ